MDFNAFFGFCQALLFEPDDNMDINQIGKRIKLCRAKQGYNQEDLAKKLGLDKGTISKMERGENAPTAKTLILLKQIFNVSIDWLLTGEQGIVIYDDDIGEMLRDISSNQEAKHKILGFFYLYKSKNLQQFISGEKNEKKVKGKNE